MQAIIIDDEKHCREGLAIKLARYCPQVEVVEQCANAKAAIKAIGKYRPDVIFLDIEMPEMTGFEMLEYCSGYDFAIIFTTAYNEYAIEAIRHSALDYLLKPVNKNELIRAVMRVAESKELSRPSKIAELINTVQGKKAPQRIAVPTINGLLMLDVKEILYCESENNYTYFHLVNEKKILISKTLKYIADLLTNNNDFFRIHNSFLINVNYTSRYIKGNGGEVIMSNGKHIPISRIKKKAFLDLLENL